MSVLPSFADILQPLEKVFTTPTYRNVLVIVSGWLFASHHTITNVILSAQALGEKHYSTFHRVFSSAVWSLDDLGLVAFSLIRPLLQEGVVFLAVDDTLCRKHGRKMFGAGMHHDPLLSSRSFSVVNHGHSWVVLGVLLSCSLPKCLKGRTFCLPVLFRLYRSKKMLGEEEASEYQSRPELFIEMLTLLKKRFPDLCFHVVADAAYCGQNTLSHLPDGCHITGRLPVESRLFGPVPERVPGRRGRPRSHGDRLPSPKQMLEGLTMPFEKALYGYKQSVRVADCVAYLYSLPTKPLRVVAVDQGGDRPKQAFFSTRSDTTAEEVLTRYAGRWAIEQTFEEAKGELGFEEPQNWTKNAVLRTAPFVLLLYDLIVLWFVSTGYNDYQPPYRPWYHTKHRASFADILTTLRA